MRWLLILLCMSCVWGYTLQGTLYDPGLDPIEQGVLYVNDQRVVVTQGTYSLNVTQGSYVLRASADDLFSQDSINVSADMIYDLILFPSIDDDLFVDFEQEGVEWEDEDDWIEYLWIPLIIIGILVVFFWHKRPRKMDSYQLQVMDIIQKEQRITQRDLRKQIPLSEAKISLLLTDLEHQGRIEKIKKGRGNILVYKR